MEPVELRNVGLEDEQYVGDARLLKCSDSVSDLLGRAVQGVSGGLAWLLWASAWDPLDGRSGSRAALRIRWVPASRRR